MDLIDNSTKLIKSHELSDTLLITFKHWIATPRPIRYFQKHHKLQMTHTTKAVS